MTKRQLKKRSKRVSLNTKYKIKKKVREHHRKLRKEARKAKNNGIAVKSTSKITKIPNMYPHKIEELEQAELKKEADRLEKQRRAHGLNDKDVEELVVEEEAKVIKGQHDDDQDMVEKKKSKNEHKRELNLLTSKSQIIIEVLDARDPLTYRSKELEKSDNPNRKVIVLINKADLVSRENLEKWVKFIRRDYPTIPFSTLDDNMIKNGIKELITITHQLATTLNWKDVVHVSIIGYPNVGKSTIMSKIKSLYTKSVKSLLVPDVREIVLTDTNIRVYDRPGYIFTKNDTGNLIPKTLKDIDDYQTPVENIKKLLELIPHDDLLELYEIKDFDDFTEFLVGICNKYNLFVKKGFHDIDRAARKVLKDVIEGKIKYQTDI